MFTLKVEAENSQFIDYLNKESSSIYYNKYIFSSYHLASIIIARFLLFFLKKTYFTTMLKHHRVKEEEKEELYSHVSVEKNQQILLLLKFEVEKFLETYPVFHLEGFLRFRVRDIEKEVEAMFEEAYGNYIDSLIGGDNFKWFREVLSQQESMIEELFLYVEEDRLVLKNDMETFLEELPENDDNVIGHAIVMAPKVLHVIDPMHLMNQQMVLIIKKAFLEKVVFYEEEHRRSGN